MRLLELHLDTAGVLFLEHHPCDSAEMAQVLCDLESYGSTLCLRRENHHKGYTRIFTSKLLADLAQAGSCGAADLRTALQSLKGKPVLARRCGFPPRLVPPGDLQGAQFRSVQPFWNA